MDVDVINNSLFDGDDFNIKIDKDNGHLLDPYNRYRYKVAFIPTMVSSWNACKGESGILRGANLALISSANFLLGFNEISTISNKTEAYSYREGGENSYINTFPDYTEASDVTFKHGATRMPVMSLLRNMISAPFDKYCSAQFSMIIFMFGKGSFPQFWVLKDVWPTKIEIGDFSTKIIKTPVLDETDGKQTGMEENKDKNLIIESLTVSVERAELDVVRGLNMAIRKWG